MLSFRTRSILASLVLACAALRADAAAFVVTSSADPGNGVCDAACTLREAIAAANANGSAVTDTITFNIGGTGPFTITVSATALPTITTPTSISASGEAISGAPGIQVDGNAIGSGNGFTFGSDADGSSLSYFSITNFPGNGITIASDSTTVTKCYVGLATDGTTAVGNDGVGISVNGLSAVIGGVNLGNVVSSNGTDGISVGSGGGGFTAIRGNKIGTDATGALDRGNGSSGITSGAASAVTVGGNSAGQGNVISGNGGAGIDLGGSTTFWGIQGNLIGLNAAGTAAIANGTYGITTTGDNHLIGSTDPVGRNVISGNTNYGILVFTGSNAVDIHGNYIGTNAAGTAAIAGQTGGIRVTGTVTNCIVGGSGATYRNVISGNSSYGLSLDADVTGCTVTGNYIGTNAAGDGAMANGTGVHLGGSNDVVGGDTAGERNVISGNTDYGVIFYGATNKLTGNYIGLNAAGTAAVPNTRGIRGIGATGGSIGGAAAGEGNVVSGNSNQGIAFDSDTSNVTFYGNLIGTNPAGTAAIANLGGLSVGGTGNLVGGSAAGQGNLVSGNSGGGIGVSGTSNYVRGNKIGTNAAGTAAIANGGTGINVTAGSGHQIGGTGAGEGNLVSGNGGGITVAGTGTVVRGNKVGTNLAGNAAIPNGGGIGVHGSNHTIGGNTAAARNVISGNPGGGFYVTGEGHIIAGNYVGVTADGTTALGNGSYGLRADTISNVLIGGFTAAEGNVFGANSRGVNLGYGSHDNTILNNIIGLNAAMTTNLPDTGTGIEIDGSWNNTIGAPGQGNVIAGMSYQGIALSGADSHDNVVQGNWIGTNKVLAAGLGNSFAGIFVSESSNNTFGGTGAGEGNVFANNYQFGVRIERGEGNEISGNSVYGNFFGIDIDEGGFFPNDGGDGDDGGNRAQNYPLISEAMIDGASTEVHGLLINEPSTEYRVEFFSSATCNAVGFGDGKNFRGSQLVTTGAGGQALWVATIPIAIPDAYLTATVTDPAGNTSEFSPCVEIDLGESAGVFNFDRPAYVGYEGVIPTTKIFVTRTLGLSGTATVQFSTSNGSAVAGSDYTDSDQTLTFAPWEVVKIVEVPILYDPTPEPVPAPEKLFLALSSPGGGASLGAQAAAEIQVWDYIPGDPGVTVDDAFVTEGNSGTKNLTFTVHLSGTDHEVKITYLTEPGSATEEVDYNDAEGVLTFPVNASPQSQQVNVPIVGDTDIEPDEIVWLRITSAENGGNWIAYDVYGRGEIRDDDEVGVDPQLANTIFADGFETGTANLWSSSVL